MIIIGLLSVPVVMYPSERVTAGSSDGWNLATAILANQSTLINAQYTDMDQEWCRQSVVLSSLGTMIPTDGSTFLLLSTGIAGLVPVTTGGDNPGSERGTWFRNRYGNPRDEATLTMELQVPLYMHYLYYDVQFFTTEYPDYIGTRYNDKFTVTVDSPSQGTTTHVIDVNGGDFVLTSLDIPDTGFDVFAKDVYTGEPTDPSDVDILTRVPGTPGADAGATALVSREHPVFPNETITVTFNIKDTGDNQFDSAVFIDNVMFSGYAKTDIIARKTVNDLNGHLPEPGDTLEYSISISNIGNINQNNNPGNEFEDAIPENTTYVSGSLTATSGTATYNEGENKITWDGNIPAESSVALTFRVTIDMGLPNGIPISNQGTVYWDSDESGTNDATELTDDPAADDGIDLDGDGDTGDDDPTTVIVLSYEPTSTLTEDFSDDIPGGNATQTYYSYKWFTTSEGAIGSNFEVASSYHYSTAQSFKTQMRSSGGLQYWDYNLTNFNSEIEWWEIWFTCGNTSEAADLILKFKDANGVDIAKIKFEYMQEGTDYPSDYVLKLYYSKPSDVWTPLASGYQGGYLYNGWYKLRLEINSTNYINYSLYQNNIGLVDSALDSALGSLFSQLASVEWSSTKTPAVCPMFFWDEHKIGIVPLS
jgi:uncharacterized repeat protein (TIGR01451 family)